MKFSLVCQYAMQEILAKVTGNLKDSTCNPVSITQNFKFQKSYILLLVNGVRVEISAL